MTGSLPFSRKTGLFGRFLLSVYITSPNTGVIVYPEGHRYKGEGSLELKTGVMEVAYNLKVPCQIVLSNGKETVMDEIHLKINKNTLITICVSDVLDPTQFKTKEEWFAFVKEEWKKTYNKLEKNETDGKEFFGPLPGITEESIVDEQVPPHRRRVAISCTVAVVAIIASLIALIHSLTQSFVCSKQAITNGTHFEAILHVVSFPSFVSFHCTF